MVNAACVAGARSGWRVRGYSGDAASDRICMVPADNRAMQGYLKVLILAGAAGLGACQPSLNWREVRSDTSSLVVLLPCKPDHGTREVPLGGRNVALDMQGCDAAGATFAVSHAVLADPAQAGQVLAGWKTAMLANMRAPASQDEAFNLPGALSLAQAVRSRATGQRADGRPVSAQAVWFARVGPGGVDVFHAVVYADKSSPEVADTFFGGLKFE